MNESKSSIESSSSEIEDLSDELVNPRLSQELRAEAETQLIEETESIVRRLKEESRRCQLYMRTLLSLSDFTTDLCLAILLFQLGYIHYPILMILIDFLPGILTLSFILSYKNKCHPLVALGFVAHPLLMPGISIAEFLDRHNSEGNGRKYRLYILDAAKYVIGNLQAPCQMILTSYLVMTDVLEPPWIQSTTRVDAQNHVVSFGPILTLFSLILSAVSSFKASTETVDIMKLYINGHVEVAVAWLTHFSLLVMFRIMAWTLLIICAGWYSLFILAAVFLFCLGILVWKHKFGEKSILGKKNLLYLEWPIPIFGLISPTVFLPESCRPSHISTPFKLINQIMTLGGNAILMFSLIICVAIVGSENHNIVSLIVVQERMFLFLQVSLILGAFSTLVTLLLIGSSHKDAYILSPCIPDILSPRKIQDWFRNSFGDRGYHHLAITSRTLIFIVALLTFVLPIALSSTSDKGSVTLLIAGYKGKGLTTHIDVLSYGRTCRAKGLPSLPEYRSESMVQLIPGHHMLVICGGQTDGTDVTNTCLATQPRKKTWRRLAPMPFRLYNAASAVFNDKMYIIGGVDEQSSVKKTVLEYEPAKDSWTVLAEMVNGLQGSCAVNLRHGLVITGGKTDTGAFISDATYFGRTDEDELAWVRLPTMLSNRAYHGCTFVTLEDFGAGILLAGGRSDDRTVLGTVEFMLIDPWGLTPITSSWIRLPNLNFPRHSYPSVGVVNKFDMDTVLVAGGLSKDLSSTDTIEELTTNPLTGRFEWIYRNVTLLKPRHSISTVVVPAYYIKPCD